MERPRTPHPELIAHRGASREQPENTLAAFRRAMELGADAVELDVHRSADGIIICHHDEQVATDSKDRLSIHETPAAQLARARVRGEPIPTLAEVLELLAGRLTVYCELKGAGTAPGALQLLIASGANGAVHAFDHRQVAEALRLAPQVPRGVLESSYPIDGLAALRSVQGRDLWRKWEFIDEALVTAAHAAGARVVAWTVNDPLVVERLAAIGVDAICTDDVQMARERLAIGRRRS